MDSVNTFGVTKGSVMNYLQTFATSWDETTIFGKPEALCYDIFLEKYRPKKNKIHTKNDVKQDIKRTVAYVKELDQFT